MSGSGNQENDFSGLITAHPILASVITVIGAIVVAVIALYSQSTYGDVAAVKLSTQMTMEAERVAGAIAQTVESERSQIEGTAVAKALSEREAAVTEVTRIVTEIEEVEVTRIAEIELEVTRIVTVITLDDLTVFNDPPRVDVIFSAHNVPESYRPMVIVEDWFGNMFNRTQIDGEGSGTYRATGLEIGTVPDDCSKEFKIHMIMTSEDRVEGIIDQLPEGPQTEMTIFRQCP